MTTQEDKRKLTGIIVCLAVLLALAIAALLLIWFRSRSFSVRIDDNFIRSDSAARYTAVSASRDYDSGGWLNRQRRQKTDDGKVYVSLHRFKSTDNYAFYAGNMFPGDTVTKGFNVRVSTPGTTTLYFGTDIRDGGEKLGEVLMCRVTMPEEDILLYEGLMSEMPESFSFPITASKRTVRDVYYFVEVWLDTSVGNEYMNKTLIADFEWWADPRQLAPPTGDSAEPYLWAGIALAACGALVVVAARKRRKEESA